MSDERDGLEGGANPANQELPAYRLPTELPVLPLRDTGTVPQFVHAACGRARKLRQVD